jgi:hypothetical protein
MNRQVSIMDRRADKVVPLWNLVLISPIYGAPPHHRTTRVTKCNKFVIWYAITNMATMKDCNACGSPIPQSAKLCSVCKTYQGGWSKVGHFFLTSLPLWVAAGSLFLWAWPAARILLFPREDIRVISLNSFDGGLILNLGDEEIFITEAGLEMTGREKQITQRFLTNEIVGPAKFMRIPRPAGRRFTKGRWIGNVAQKDWHSFFDQAAADERCFSIEFFVKDDPFLKSILSADPTINTHEATGYLEYHSVRVQYRRVSVPALGVVYINNETSDCATKYHVR